MPTCRAFCRKISTAYTGTHYWIQIFGDSVCVENLISTFREHFLRIFLSLHITHYLLIISF